MHDFYNTEMYTRNRCQDLLEEAENERRLAQIAPELPFNYVSIVIEPRLDGGKRIMVEVC